MFNPAIMGKALKVKKLMQDAPIPAKHYEGISDNPDGTAVYEFQALFSSKAEAERFMELCQLSAALEAEIAK